MLNLRVLFNLIVEYTLLLPFFLLSGILLSHNYLIGIWLTSFALAYIIGALFKAVFKKQNWWVYALFVVVAGVSLGLFVGDHWTSWIVLMIAYPIVIYRGISHLTTDSETLLSIPVLWVGGFTTYFVAYLFFRNLDTLVDYLSILTVGGFIFVVSTLFMSNSKQLRTSTLSKEKTPAINQTIKRQNRVYLSLTVIIILILSLGNFVQDTLFNLVSWFLNMLAGDGEIKELPPEESHMDNGGMAGPFNDEAGEPSIFWEILQTIAMYVVFIALAIVAVLLLLLLLKKTRGWVIKAFHNLMAYLKTLGGRFNDESENALYKEEKENIFNFKDWTDDRKKQMRSFANRVFKRKINWDTLNNREKVRFVYRNFISQHTDDKMASETPREILDKLTNEPDLNREKLTALRRAYEEVRYGDQEISDAQIEKIHQLIQK